MAHPNCGASGVKCILLSKGIAPGTSSSRRHHKDSDLPVSYLNYLLLPLSRLLLLTVYLLAGFLPRRRDLWVFGSWGGSRFADNSAAFFRHCRHAVGERVRLVWISRDPEIVKRLRAEGYEAHRPWSLRGMLACAQAGVHVFDCFAKDTNFWLSRGAIKVNLWSGASLKAFERDIDNRNSRYYRLFHGFFLERWLLAAMMPWHVERPDLIVASSEETAGITARAFGVSADRVVVSGLPRNDVLLGPPHRQLLETEFPVAFREALSAGRMLFLYLPTFRDGGRHDPGIDWRRVSELMERVGGEIFCKFHPDDRSSVRPPTLPYVTELNQSLDVYPLLPHLDALVSDYSSVIFDFMLLDRPIIYFTPDVEEFAARTRKLNWQPEELGIGPICKEFDELTSAMEAAANAEGLAGPQARDTVLPRLHRYVDGQACTRVLRVIDRRYFDGSLLETEPEPRPGVLLVSTRRT